MVRNDLQARKVKVEVETPIEGVEIEVEIIGSRVRFISPYIPPYIALNSDHLHA